MTPSLGNRLFTSADYRSGMGHAIAKQAASAGWVGIAYFLACAGAIQLTRFDGGVAFIWIANAILTARLSTLPVRRWTIPIATCFIAGTVATATFGFGPALAIPLGFVNVGESVAGAALLRLMIGRRIDFGSHRGLFTFVLATGIVAPLAGSLGAAGALTAMAQHSFLSTAFLWYKGHALGTLAFMPIALLFMRSDRKSLLWPKGGTSLGEQVVLVLLVLAVTLAAFRQNELPLLFLPLLPIVFATFRGGAVAAAVSIVVVTLIGGVLTAEGHGPIALMDGTVGSRMQFLQFYVACTMLTVLPANAELERRAELFRRLSESEARYRLVTENSTDIVLSTDLDGRLRFVSSSIQQMSGQSAEELIGEPFIVLLHADDAPRALAALQMLISGVEGAITNEYRGLDDDDGVRWFETQSRAVTDSDGIITGAVIAVRDVTHRKAHEERLARAALTDGLTGLVNRRGLDEALAARLAAGDGGCLALFDLDHFKQVNDTYGHAVGDEVLRRFAALARAIVREQDMVARLGGEEFAIILPDATIEQAKLVCDRLRQAISDARLRIDETIVCVTVSGGVTAYGSGDSVTSVLQSADVALYRAKRGGRDRLALAA